MLYVQFTNVSPSPNSFGCVNNLLILLFLKSLIISSRFFVLEVNPTPLYFSANCSISCWNWHQIITGLSPTSSKQSSNTLFLVVSKSGGTLETTVGYEKAKKAVEKGITEVVFDRGGYVYHGRVAALAEGAREGGLNF